MDNTEYTNGVYIKWVDSRLVGVGWEYIEDIKNKNICVIESYGRVIAETKDYYHISPHIGQDPEQSQGSIVIPKCSILEMRALRVTKPLLEPPK